MLEYAAEKEKVLPHKAESFFFPQQLPFIDYQDDDGDKSQEQKNKQTKKMPENTLA